MAAASATYGFLTRMRLRPGAMPSSATIRPAARESLAARRYRGCATKLRSCGPASSSGLMPVTRGLGSPRTIPSMREAISPRVYDSKGRPSAARRLRRLLRLLGRLLRLRLRGGGRGGGLVHVVELLDQVLGDVDLGRVVVDDALVEDEREILFLAEDLQGVDEHLLEPVLYVAELRFHLARCVVLEPVELDRLVLDIFLHLRRLVLAQARLLLPQLVPERVDLRLLLVDIALQPVARLVQVLVVLLPHFGDLPDCLRVEDADFQRLCRLRGEGRGSERHHE